MLKNKYMHINFHIRGRLTLLLVGFALFSFGQNDFFFSHYMLNPSYYNPAWVGIEKEGFVSFQHRSQWLGYATSSGDPGGDPSSQLLSVVVPVHGKLAGLGLTVSNDRIATLSNLQARLSVSIEKDFRFGHIAVGLMPGIYSQSLDFSLLRPVEPEPDIPSGKESQIRTDLNAGIWFVSNRNYYVGFSAIHILQPVFDYGATFTSSTGEQLNNQILSNYLITGGTSIGITRDLIIEPSVLARTDFKSYTFEISAIVTYQDKMWGGLSFRKSESLTLLLGYSFLDENKLKFGYSFDYVIQDRDAKQPTSHEVYIRYNLPSLIFGGRKVVKTPRFVF